MEEKSFTKLENIMLALGIEVNEDNDIEEIIQLLKMQDLVNEMIDIKKKRHLSVFLKSLISF